MNYHFTFKTNEDLRKAERESFDNAFDIVRVNFKYPGNNTIYDIPLKTEEEYNNFLTKRIPNEKLNVEKFYQDKHGFELGKLDYLNYLDENKKTMKNKMTVSDLKKYVIAEATKLYKIEVLKEEKEGIENQLMEIDKRAMKAAKKDIEADFLKFTPLGKNRFEKHLDKKELEKAMSPEKNLDEKKYSDKASKVIGKEISHLQKDKGYPHDRAVAAAINVAKDKGFKVPPAKNEASQVFAGTDNTNPDARMYFFKIHHDNGTDKLKIADFSKENAKKVIAKFMNAPESAVEFVKEEPITGNKIK